MAGSLSNRLSRPAEPEAASARTWFIALPLLNGARLLRTLTPPPAAMRVLHELDLHLTLAFLGRTTFADAERAWEAARGPLTPLAEGAPELVAASVVPMGAATRFSALAVVPHEDAEARRVCATIRRCVRALSSFGVVMHRDGPRPHVTVARIPRQAAMPVRHKALDWAAAQQVDGVEMRFGTPTLYCRDRDPESGAFYRGVLRLAS